MKGVIVKCLEELVLEKFGEEKWKEALEDAGLDRKSRFLATSDVDDDAVLNVVNSVCKVLNISLSQAADAFGDHWMNVYAPKIYAAHFRGFSSAKEFLLAMDQIHVTTTKNIPNARPPRFDYKWQDKNTLIMTYHSSRGLIDFFVGLVKGVGIHFGETLSVSKIGSDKVKIVFAN